MTIAVDWEVKHQTNQTKKNKHDFTSISGKGGHYFLAHRIRISEILPWDRQSYLTHAILPRLSREGYIHWLYWNSRKWSSSDVIVMVKWSHHVKLHLSIFWDFWKLIFK